MRACRTDPLPQGGCRALVDVDPPTWTYGAARNGLARAVPGRGLGDGDTCYDRLRHRLTYSMNDLNTTIVTLETLENNDLQFLAPDAPHRIDVVAEHSVLPFLVVPRTGADKLLVLNNGAVDHQIAQGRPVFQRSSWWREIRHHQIYFCDPGTLGTDQLSLAWGQLSREHWVVYDAARAVKALSAQLGVQEPDRRIYYGSSAGGFMALALMAGDAGATAVVNNAQFDWTRWMATGLNPLREARFDNMLPSHLRKVHPVRTNVLKMLAKRRKPVRIVYYVNLASKHDREVDRPMFEAFVRSHPRLTRNVEIRPYEDPVAGHNPMSKERTLEILNCPQSSTAPLPQSTTVEHVSNARLRVGGGSPRGSVKSEEGHPPMRISVDSLASLDGSVFPAESPTRIDIETDHVTIPLLVVRRDGATGLCTLSNAAVGLEKSGGRATFQRSSWWKDIFHHQIYVCDPATVDPGAVSLAWGQISPDYWMVPDAAVAIQRISSLLGVDASSDRVYYGSSGGGFLSVALSAHDPGSRAVINNSQFDWTTWIPRTVTTLTEQRLGGMDAEAFKHSHPERASVLDLMLRTPPASHVDYWVNLGSDHDAEVDLGQVKDFLYQHPDFASHWTVHTYQDAAAGHDAIDKATTVRIINDSIDRDEARSPWMPGTQRLEMRSTMVAFQGREWKMYGATEDDHIFRMLHTTGQFYEEQLLSFISTLVEPGDLVLDVGANIGNHTVFFAGPMGCTVESYEALPVLLPSLTGNVMDNFLDERVEIIPSAVGASSGRLGIRSWDPQNVGSTSLEIRDDGPIAMTTLDAKSRTVPVRLIKIDVEGMELDVLAGARATIGRDRPILVIEARDEEMDRRLRNWLADHDYVVLGVFNATPTLVAMPASGNEATQALDTLANALSALVSRFNEFDAKLDKFGRYLSQHTR